jgi:putative transcriptional regulator
LKGSRTKAVRPLGRSKRAARSRDGLSAGTKILDAIQEATEILRSDGLASPRITMRTYEIPPAPRTCQAADVKRVREMLGTSQAVFARFLGINVNTLRSWEQGRRLPQAIACRFLREIEADPIYWRQRFARAGVDFELRTSRDD